MNDPRGRVPALEQFYPDTKCTWTSGSLALGHIIEGGSASSIATKSNDSTLPNPPVSGVEVDVDGLT